MPRSPFTFHVLGSGASAPAGGGAGVRNPAGYALQTPDGVLLFDLGFGGLRQLYRAGLESRQVSHAFFSHRHPDHVGDLAALLFHLRSEAKPDAGLLQVFGPRGFAAFCRRLRRAHAPWLEPSGFELTVRELKGGERVDGPGWRVRCLAVPHATPALAYRLDSKSRSLCYSGDTGMEPELARFGRGVDLLVLECTLADRARVPGHLRVRDALRLAQASRARRVVLSHLSVESAREARGRLPERVALARDGMRLRL